MKDEEKQFNFDGLKPKKKPLEKAAEWVGYFIAGLACLAVVVLLIVAIIFLIKLI